MAATHGSVPACDGLVPVFQVALTASATWPNPLASLTRPHLLRDQNALPGAGGLCGAAVAQMAHGASATLDGTLQGQSGTSSALRPRARSDTRPRPPAFVALKPRESAPRRPEASLFLETISSGSATRVRPAARRTSTRAPRALRGSPGTSGRSRSRPRPGGCGTRSPCRPGLRRTPAPCRRAAGPRTGRSRS